MDVNELLYRVFQWRDRFGGFETQQFILEILRYHPELAYELAERIEREGEIIKTTRLNEAETLWKWADTFMAMGNGIATDPAPAP